MVCRGLLLMLERAGQISLPPIAYTRHNPLAQPSRPAPAPVDQTPLEAQPVFRSSGVRRQVSR